MSRSANQRPGTNRRGTDFRDVYGDVYYNGEQADIRDEPYRSYGPRGVRGMENGKWGFFSKNCLSG